MSSLRKFLLFLLLLTNIKSQYLDMDVTMQQPFLNYIDYCRRGVFLPNRRLERVDNPKISLVIPMYNEENNVLPIIRSVQNQNLQEFEIICINDNSNDGTLSILKSLQKEDPRINIITNKVNRGVIYNRIYGGMMAKGEYVTFLDADDSLANIDILNVAYETATKKFNEKIDIVHYQSCGSMQTDNGKIESLVIFNTYNPNNFDKIVRKPYIGDNYMQKKKDVTGSGLVFDKIYKKDLIYRIADYLGPHIWNQNLIYVDDFLLAFAAMKTADTIVNIASIGYFHLIDKQTSTTSNVWEIEGDKLKNPEKSNKKIGDYMTILERMLQLTENEPQSLEFRESIIYELVNDDYLKAIARSVHYEKYLSLFEMMFNWKYADEDSKKRIREKVNKIFEFKIDAKRKYSDLLK
jgi:glycosyltransferase involved in cell wall biosynthesis